MVVGNGLLANAFKHYEHDDQIIIFASGVSNSKETNEKEFEREEKLLKSIPIDKMFVYFSTCSIYDLSAQGSQYVRHKMHMERLIHMYFENYIIFRLPTIVGKTNNPHTFFNYFKDKINNNSEIKVDALSSRYLIDIDDLSNFLSGIIERHRADNEIGQKKINIAFDNKTMVIDIVEMMMKILDKKSDIVLSNNGCDYEFEKKYFEDYLKSINYKEPENYTYNLLKKYLL